MSRASPASPSRFSRVSAPASLTVTRSTSSRRQREAANRESLSDILGESHEPRRVMASRRKGGNGPEQSADIDAVSADGRIVAQIKTSAWFEPDQRREIVTDSVRMYAVKDAERRLLSFSTKMSADNACGVSLPPGTEVVLVDLRRNAMHALFDETAKARAEMGGRRPLSQRRLRPFDEGLCRMQTRIAAAADPDR